MQVLFKLIVLCELNNGKKNGYQIIKKIGEHYGKKPSAGTIFPFLDRMLSEDIISVKKEGRENIYSLTKKGKKLYDSIIKDKEDVILNLFELYRFLTKSDELYDNIRDKINKLKDKSCVMRQLKKLSEMKKLSLITILTDDFNKCEKDFELIIDRTISDLKMLNNKRLI